MKTNRPTQYMRNPQYMMHSVLGIIFISAFMYGCFLLAENAWERVLPASAYFEYDQENPVVPLQTSYAVGEFPKFHSNAIYKQDILMAWYDTLVCINTDATTTRYPTQVWIDYKLKGPEPSGTSWAYTQESIRPKAVSCQICGVIVGKTNSGQEKHGDYCSSFFLVTPNNEL